MLAAIGAEILELAGDVYALIRAGLLRKDARQGGDDVLCVCGVHPQVETAERNRVRAHTPVVGNGEIAPGRPGVVGAPEDMFAIRTSDRRLIDHRRVARRENRRDWLAHEMWRAGPDGERARCGRRDRMSVGVAPSECGEERSQQPNHHHKYRGSGD
jgi:hypothetical protein